MMQLNNLRHVFYNELTYVLKGQSTRLKSIFHNSGTCIPFKYGGTNSDMLLLMKACKIKLIY